MQRRVYQFDPIYPYMVQFIIIKQAGAHRDYTRARQLLRTHGIMKNGLRLHKTGSSSRSGFSLRI